MLVNQQVVSGAVRETADYVGGTDGPYSAEREAMSWNTRHGDALRIEVYDKPSGEQGTRIPADELNGRGWVKDYASGQIVKLDGDAPGYDVSQTEGVLSDGNGHYWDAHDLPKGLSWDKESKCPDVMDGYVMGPDGYCWDEAYVSQVRDRDGSYDSDWTYAEDGVFRNKTTGELWKYDKDVAEIQAEDERQAADAYQAGIPQADTDLTYRYDYKFGLDGVGRPSGTVHPRGEDRSAGMEDGRDLQSGSCRGCAQGA